MQLFKPYCLYGAGNRLQDAIKSSLDPWQQFRSHRPFCSQRYPRPLRFVSVNDLAGMWVTVRGDQATKP